MFTAPSPLNNFNAAYCGSIFTPPYSSKQKILQKSAALSPQDLKKILGLETSQATMPQITLGFGHQGYDRLIDCDFDNAEDVYAATNNLIDTGPCLFIAHDLLSYLEDPRILLRRLRHLLKAKEGNKALFTVPFHKHEGQIRFWTRETFFEFLRDTGFVVEAIHDHGGDGGTEKDAIFIASCTQESYVAFLAEKNLAPPSPYLFVTTETTRHKKYGGIASYLENIWKVFPQKPILYATFPLPPDLQRTADEADLATWIMDRTYFSSNRLASGSDIYSDDLTAPVLEDLRQLLFLYDDIKLIEIQDFIGDAARLSQAKNAGLIAPDITILCRGHGSHIYLERANEAWFDTLAYEKFMLNERLAIETADHFLPASDYLRKLYLQNGIHLPFSTKVLPLPYISKNKIIKNERDTRIESPDTIVFYGKTIAAKGFPDFVAALKNLARTPVFQEKIKKIILLGGDIPQEDQAFFKTLPPSILCETGFKPYNETQETLAKLGPRAFVIMPYRADNWPMSVLEAIEANTHPIAYATGGIPEIIGEEGTELCLCENTPQNLAQHILKMLAMKNEERTTRLEKFRAIWRERQKKINKETPEFYRVISTQNANAETTVAPKESTFNNETTFIVSLINATKSWFLAVQKSIQAQLHTPQSIIFVAPENSSFLSALSELESDEVQLLIVPQNTTLETARKKGLAVCATKFVAFIDSGYIPLPRFLHDSLRAFSKDNNCRAAFGFVRQILEGNHIESARAGVVVSPLGLSGFLTHRPNAFGPSCALFRADDIKNTSFARQDLADLYLHLSQKNGKIAVIPRVNLTHEILPQEKKDLSFFDEYALLSHFSSEKRWENGRALALACRKKKKNTPNPENLSLHPASLEGLLEAISQARLNKIPPATILWPQKTDQNMKEEEEGEFFWNEAPAHKIAFTEKDHAFCNATAQAETLNLKFTVVTLPSDWCALFQHGDSLKNYRVKIMFNPSGDIWIECGAPNLERPIAGFEIPQAIREGEAVDLRLSIFAKTGTILIWLNGERVVSDLCMPWNFPPASLFWISSRRYRGIIHEILFYKDFLTESDQQAITESSREKSRESPTGSTNLPLMRMIQK